MNLSSDPRSKSITNQERGWNGHIFAEGPHRRATPITNCNLTWGGDYSRFLAFSLSALFAVTTPFLSAA